MAKKTGFGLMVLVVAAVSAAALADGMIVPVRPDIRVRGHWAVKYHRVNIRVRDQVASVSIDQEFVNTGGGMIEVEYLFPVPPDAAIDSMTMIVNGKEFSARLMDADEARRVYESIVRKKKDPALLEYAGFGLYKTRAFPLEAGKPCKVVVTYKNICRKDGDLVEVWYPLNTEKFSAKPIDDVTVTVDVKEKKADITAVYSPTHDLKVQRKGPRHVIATYHEEKTLPTNDFQVFYKAANEKIGATLLTHQSRADRDGQFMLLVSPNVRAAEKRVVAKDVVVVFDHSGSMSGRKITQARAAVQFVLKNLNEPDRFNVIAYNDAVEPFFDKLVDADEKHVCEALDRLDRIDATGGTNIHDALNEAMRTCSARSQAGRPAYVIFMTDGLPTVGKTKDSDILSDTHSANKCKARLFAFGVGYDVNVRLLDKLVLGNGGRSDYVRPKEPIEAKISSLYSKIRNPVMTNLRVTIRHLRLRDMYPREVGDLFDGDQLVLVGRYSRKDALQLTAGKSGLYHTQLLIKGVYQGREKVFEYPVTVRGRRRDARFAFIEKIWAMRRVGYLLGQIQLHGKSKEVIDELVRLSKEYGIMTPYTSFLADETSIGASRRALHAKATSEAAALGRDSSGFRGQAGAMTRQRLNLAARAPAPGGVYKMSRVIGSVVREDYEAGRSATVANVRQFANQNQAMYRRGRTWVTPETEMLDLKKDAARIQEIRRFSEEYFELVRRNTRAENEVLASQRAGEQLLVKLRSQTYLIR